jgi:hypothetical protein
MHLDREHFMRIKELQQQWKSGKTPGQLSQHLLWKLLQQLADCPAFERSIGYQARMVIAVAEYPRLPNRAAWQRCSKQVGQTPTAPQPILIDRLESQRIQRDLRSGGFLLVVHQARFTRHHSLTPDPSTRRSDDRMKGKIREDPI